MSSIEIYTIATFVIVAFVCVRYALFASRTFNAYERDNRSRERNVTNYVGHYYNRHGNQID